MIRQTFAAIAALGLLAACASSPDAPALTPAQTVYALKVGYQAPLAVAVSYNSRPRCGRPTSPPICSDQAVVEQLRKGNVAALAALDAAESIVRTPGVGDSAVRLAIATAQNGTKAVVAILETYGAK